MRGLRWLITAPAGEFLMALAIAVCGLLLMVIVVQGQPWERYHGMREVSYNRGPFIDTANRRYAYLQAPYCASSVSVMLDRIEATTPRYRGGASRRFITARSIDAKRVYNGRDTLPIPSLAIWIRPGGGGHVALVLGVSGRTIYTFEFNTSPGVGGSQWNGVWSGYRTRSWSDMSPLRAMRITHFTPITVSAN